MLTTIEEKLTVLALALLLLASLYGFGDMRGRAVVNAKWKAAQAMNDAQLEAAKKVSAQITTRVVIQYVDRVQVIHDRAATIVKEVPVYVTAKADAACVVPVGFVRLHDAAVQNEPLPAAAGSANDAASGVALSTVASVDAENFGTCHETAAQLTALQDWVASQAAVK